MTKIQKPTIEAIKPGGIQRPAKIKKPPQGKAWPDFNSLFAAPEFNPLDDATLIGDIDADVAEEGERVKEAFIENEQTKLDGYRDMIDPEFFFVVCFQSRAQKDEFLDKSGLSAAGLGDKYLDGLQLARYFGVDVAPIPIEGKKPPAMPRLLRGVKIIGKGGDS